MKKIATIFTSVLLCVTMLALLPAQVVASAADNAKKYVSEVKVGMGETSEEAAKELLAEGFTILTNDKGEYADLNKDAGSKSILKDGPNQKIVYMGYKTTANANNAVTDLAVMNMNGGYSYQNYEDLINKHMDTRIKPFVERFVATLEEYRANLKKPQDSLNYKRANYYKILLNKLTDDDTGKPLGDLLVNQTKFEMGDAAYNKLSDAEKKNHCDITTLLLQGNGQAVMLMETQLTKASDPGSNTWIDRFVAMTPESLTESVTEDNPGLTPSEVNAEMDKLYYDDAKRILEKWDAFTEILDGYDDAVDKADENAEQETEEPKQLTDQSTKQEIVDEANKTTEAQESMVEGSMAAEDVIVKEYLESTKYADGTLLDFFQRSSSDFSGEEGIRELYPIVESLTGGQLAGLDFVSIKEMILMAVTNEKGFAAPQVDGLEAASVYQDVNREVYQKGNVALTSDALREEASNKDSAASFNLSPLGYVFWACTGLGMVATASSVIAMSQRFKPQILKNVEKWQMAVFKKNTEIMKMKSLDNHFFKYDSTNPLVERNPRMPQAIEKVMLKDLQKNPQKLREATMQFARRSAICRGLAIGFSLVTAVLAGISIYTTIAEMKEYYKVSFAPIPKYIVDENEITVTVRPDGTVVTDPEEKKDEKNVQVFTKNEAAYYKVVTCNRTDGSGTALEKKNHEILQDRSDLNGDVGKQWLALYTARNENRYPILADSFKVVTGSDKLPDGYATGIHRFGSQAAFNLTSEFYCYNDTPKGTFVYFKNSGSTVGQLTAAGSIVSNHFDAICTLIGIVVGSALTLIIVNAVNMKKKKKASA